MGRLGQKRRVGGGLTRDTCPATRRFHASEFLPKNSHPDPVERCLVRAVADAMKEEPALGAVKIDRRRRSISVATLGKPEAAAQLEESLTQQIHQLERSGQDQSCDLLGGKSDCSVCPVPLSSDDRKRVTIEHGADTTTISRVTCPTAPSFWRWRDIPWPKFVPREVLLPDEAAHEDEWKFQLLGAGLCGLFGLTAYALGGSSISLAAYALAYAAGAWFTVQEVWERLQKGRRRIFHARRRGGKRACAGQKARRCYFYFRFRRPEHYAMGRTQH